MNNYYVTIIKEQLSQAASHPGDREESEALGEDPKRRGAHESALLQHPQQRFDLSGVDFASSRRNLTDYQRQAQCSA